MFGLFKKFKDGFAKTFAAIGEKTRGLFGGRKIDATSLGELEEALYTADFGVATNRDGTLRLDKTKTGRAMNLMHGAFAVGAIIGPLALRGLQGAGMDWSSAYRGMALLFAAMTVLIVALPMMVLISAAVP